MTNEEALRILHCPDTVGGLYSKKYGEALNMAMEALKREPCEDCISRQAAIEAMGEQPLNWTNSSREIAEEMMWEDHVKALKELPSVTPAVDDCISRQAVLDDIQSNWDWETVDGITATTVLRQVMTDITNAPSVTPARPKGKWEYVRYDRPSIGNYHCSLCRCIGEPTNFCPNCGAKMVEPQKSEE